MPAGTSIKTEGLPISAQTLDVSSADASFARGAMIRVGGAGTVTYRSFGGRADVSESFAAGDIVPVVISAVRMTGTTATNLVAYTWEPIIAAPDAPTGLAAVAGVSNVALSWSAPDDDGGAALQRYEVRTDSGAWVDVGLVTAYTVTGLTTGTSYAFTVRAINVSGRVSAASTAASGTPT